MSDQILIVDDEPSLKIALETFIAGSDCTLFSAESVEEAKNLLARKQFKVVILDNRLSNSLNNDGLEILGYIRKRSLSPKVIFLTGYGSNEVKRRVLGLGADFYLEKPISIAILLDAIRKLGVAC